MHSATIGRRFAVRAAYALALVAAGTEAIGGDEPGIFGRIFRGGGHPPASRPADRPAPPRDNPAASPPPAALPPPVVDPVVAADASAAPRLRPQPRVNRAATEADPILTRIALGRSDHGDQFGMFLQVYADGTVLDGEGVHRAGPDAMRPLLQALQAAELGRIHGHCGAPPTDFIEQVYVTVYERTKLGGLRANTFSFTGNPQGCDPAVRQLHAAIENLTTKLSRPASPAAPAPAPTAAAPTAPPAPVLSLTPAH